jgi:serine/threonine protein kinase
MQLEPGVVVAEHYRLEELIGRGGMGAVWRATDLRLGRTVAMKVLHTDLRDDPSLRERFQREARLLASIDHPAIVPIFHLGVIEDGAKQCPCIVMPFVKGRTLAEALRKQGRFTLEQAIPLVKALLDALSVAHAMGVVHRDLKPQNIVLEDRGGSTVVRLLDFGIAKNVSASPSAGSVMATRAGMLLGTPEYMSPEQVRDPSSVDGRADLWAVGVILYEMLTGQPPFTGDNQIEIIAKVLTSTPRRATEVQATLPPQVDTLFNKLFDRNPDERFRTALQFSEALDPLAAGSMKTVPFAWDGGTIDPSAKNPGVISKSFGSMPAPSIPGYGASSQASQPTPTPNQSIPSLSAITATPVTTSNSFDSPEVKSIPVRAEAQKQPEYFGAVNFEASAPNAAITTSKPAPIVGPTPATTTQSGRALTIVALIIPIGFVVACALTVFAFARC